MWCATCAILEWRMMYVVIRAPHPCRTSLRICCWDRVRRRIAILFISLFLLLSFSLPYLVRFLPRLAAQRPTRCALSPYTLLATAAHWLAFRTGEMKPETNSKWSSIIILVHWSWSNRVASDTYRQRNLPTFLWMQKNSPKMRRNGNR